MFEEVCVGDAVGAGLDSVVVIVREIDLFDGLRGAAERIHGKDMVHCMAAKPCQPREQTMMRSPNLLVEDLAGEESIVVKKVVLQLLDEYGRTLRAGSRKNEVSRRSRAVDKGNAESSIFVLRQEGFLSRSGALGVCGLLHDV